MHLFCLLASFTSFPLGLRLEYFQAVRCMFLLILKVSLLVHRAYTENSPVLAFRLISHEFVFLDVL